jgi:hypothetical protein
MCCSGDREECPRIVTQPVLRSAFLLSADQPQHLPGESDVDKQLHIYAYTVLYINTYMCVHVKACQHVEVAAHSGSVLKSYFEGTQFEP